MHIQWFPGHMHKAQLQIKESLPKVDLLIELLDARIPGSSANPLLAELRGDKPCLKVLSKSDLADPAQTSQWQSHFERQSGIKARAVTTAQTGTIARLIDACHQWVPQRSGQGKPIRTMIVGIPNVGKSTLINILAGRKIAKTGNAPAVTKNQQRINIGKGVVLLDTPGVLWPNVENKNSGYRLAATGAIKDTVLEITEVAFFVANYLLSNYPEALATRYALDAAPVDPTALFDAIGKKRGCLAKGGVVDYDRTSQVFIKDLRAGDLGPITLETPEIFAAENSARLATETKAVDRQQARKARRRDDQQAKRNHKKQAE